MYTQCIGGDCEECHNRLYTPFYSTEAQADYTAHELGHIMLNIHNAAKAESKGLEIMKAANNTILKDGLASMFLLLEQIRFPAWEFFDTNHGAISGVRSADRRCCES